MTANVAIPAAVPQDTTDLGGKTVPALCREAVGFAGMTIGARMEIARRFLYITEEERWLDPLKYGRDHDDLLFGFDRLHRLSPRELGDYLGGVTRRLAQSYYDAVRLIGESKLAQFTPRAIEVLAPYPEALKRACRADTGEIVTESQAKEIIRPWMGRKPRRASLPLDDDERKALARQLAQLEKENRNLRQETARLKAGEKALKGELRLARDEVAELQKRLYAK